MWFHWLNDENLSPNQTNMSISEQHNMGISLAQNEKYIQTPSLIFPGIIIGYTHCRVTTFHL